MPDQPIDALAKKLRVSPDMSLLALNAPEAYLGQVSQCAARIATTPEDGQTVDAAHLFVRTLDEARVALPVATAALRPNGILWVMWPKKSSGVKTDLTRDTLARMTMTLGWGPVSNVSIDDTWSALRLRPEIDVKRAGVAWSLQE